MTGSPRLDDLARDPPPVGGRHRRARAARPGHGPPITWCWSRPRSEEAQRALPAFLDAAAALPGVRVAIKTHPAETPERVRRARAGRAHVSVLPASATGAAAGGQPRRRHRQFDSGAGRCRAGGSRARRGAAEQPVAVRRGRHHGGRRGRDGREPGPWSEFCMMRSSGSSSSRRRAFLTRFHIGSDGRAAERGAAAASWRGQAEAPRDRSKNVTLGSEENSDLHACSDYGRRRLRRVAPGRGPARARRRGVRPRQPLDRVDRQHRPSQAPSAASTTRSTR